MNRNVVVILGRLGQDPELRYTPSGKAVANMSVALTNYVKKPDGGYDPQTIWLKVVAWDKLAERVVQQAKKGTEVDILGRLNSESWEDKNTGKTVTRIFITANDVGFGRDRITSDDQPDVQEKQDKEEKPEEKPEEESAQEEIPTSGGGGGGDGDDLPF